ncbi:glycosyltransferase [Nanoarchaeota archaeon]
MKISIIVPMYNAEKTIIGLLKALDGQSYDVFEVIFVDDGSNDNSVEIISNFKSRFKIKVVKQKNQGPAVARNVGVGYAKGEIIVFTDSDCVPYPNWLEEMVKPFKNDKIVGVQGTYDTLNKNKLMARYVGYEIAFRHKKMARVSEIDFIGTYSAAYRKDVFTDAGGFDTKFKIASGEDPELSFRIKKKGYKMVFNPKAIVKHPHVDGLFKYLKQQFYRGYWRVPMYKAHKEKITKDTYSGMEIFIQTILVSFLFVSVVLSIVFMKWYYVVGGIGLLILSNIPLGVFSGKREAKFFILAPIIASIRSIVGYLGAIKGFLKFGFR